MEESTEEFKADAAVESITTHICQVADQVFDFFAVDEQDKLLEGCREALRTCCELEEDYKNKKAIVSKVKEIMNREGYERSAKEIYNELLQKSNTQKRDPKEYPKFKNFLDVIKEGEKRVQEREMATTSTAGAVETAAAEVASGGAEDEAEGDVQMTTMEVNTLDPITKKEMKDPFKSSKCNHTFERSSIMALLKDKVRVKCPIAGCGWITAKDLVPDIEMKRIILARKAKPKRRRR